MKFLKNRKITLIFLLFLLLPGFLIVASNSSLINNNALNYSLEENNFLNTSQLTEREIRVAIYNEPNTTAPSYPNTGTYSNNYSLVKSILESAGFQVSTITTDQIYNHELLTVSYDVFVMVDNLPREKIVNYVKEFWLGGGGILSFDSAINYLCYAGMLPPEAAGTSGYTTYWGYVSTTSVNITLRHPVSRAHHVNETMSVSATYNWATFYWSALSTSSIKNNLHKIATKTGASNDAAVVAYDPTQGKGKVVHILMSLSNSLKNLIIDAVDWMCPRPKGRIAYDLSHSAFYGVDPWDV